MGTNLTVFALTAWIYNHPDCEVTLAMDWYRITVCGIPSIFT